MKAFAPTEKVKKLYQEHIDPLLPMPLKATALINGLALWKIPLLFFVRPKVLRLDSQACEIKIALSRRTKNHLGSMYFGAMAIGADAVVGILGLFVAQEEKAGWMHLSFKDFQIQFHKRAEGPVIFCCEEGEKIRAQVQEALKTGQRVNIPVPGFAFVEGKRAEPVANFTLTLSLKKK